MNFEFLTTPAAITAICSLISAVVSALISKLTAESVSNKEIRKMKLSWVREDMVSTDDDFAEMIKAITTFLYYRDDRSQLDALQSISVVRAKENGALAPLVDDVYHCVQVNQYDAAEKLTSELISIKRIIKNAGSQVCR